MANPTYSTGTVSVAANGTTVTGSGTIWSGVNAKAGDIIYIGTLGGVKVKDVTDATHLTLWSPWAGGAQSGVAYTIVQDYPARVVGVAAAEDVGVMLAQLNSLGPIFNVPTADSVPDPSYGTDGQYAHQQITDTWWLKTGGAWAVTGSPVKGYGGTSTTSLVIANAVTRVFTTQANLAYNGARVRAASAAAPANYMEGVCTYSGTTLTMTVDGIGGSGTKADWVFATAGLPGDMSGSNNLSELTNTATARANLQVAVAGTTLTGVDLDTVTTTGSYGTDNTCTNVPAVGFWYLTVQLLTANPSFCVQSARELQFYPQRTYSRKLQSGVWGPWERVAAPLRNYLAGLALSTAGSSATFGVAAGAATNSTNVDTLSLAGAYTKTTSAWTVGTATGALDTGAIANSTWYHVYAIKRLDTGVVDVLISLSATAPTLPTNYTLFRRVGSMKTNGSSQWTKFIQEGDAFTWDVPVQDVNAANPGTAAVTRTVSTPLGARVEGIFMVGFSATAQADNPGAVFLSDLSIADSAPSGFGSFFAYSATAAINNVGGVVRVLTNTSSQIRSRVQISTAAMGLLVTTFGWVDRRGKDS